MIHSMLTGLSLLFLLFLFSFSSAMAATSTFSAEFNISTQTLSVNESLEVTLVLHYPANYQVFPGILRDHLLQAPFTLVSENRPPMTVEGDHTTQVLHYILEPTKAGTYWLSFFTVSFRPKAGTSAKKVSIVVPGKPVTVTPFAAPRQELPLADLAPLTKQLPAGLDRMSQLYLFARQELEPEANQRHLAAHAFPWHNLAGLAILFTLGWGLIVALTRFRRYKEIGVASRRPMITATQRLNALERSHLVESRNYEAFFIDLTSLVRNYVEEKTGIPAKEETTQEFLEKVVESRFFSSQECQLLADLLTYADQIKFAKKSSTVADCRIAASYAREFLEN